MEKKQAEMMATLEKEKKRRPSESGVVVQQRVPDGTRRKHSRSVSGNQLGGEWTSRRLSTMKVEDWQRYQQETDAEAPRQQQQVPFPADRRRKEREYLN